MTPALPALLILSTMEVGACTGTTAPDCLVDSVRILDRSTLGLAVGTPWKLAIDAKTVVTVVEIQFEDAPWKGSAWPHQIQLYFPEEETAFESVAIYSEVTPGGSLFPDAAIVDAFGARTAAATGVPVAIVGDIPPQPVRLKTADGSIPDASLAACFEEAGDETRWMDCAMRTANTTGDATWSPFAALASSYLRATVALQAAGEVLEARGTKGFHPKRFVIGGYSKRGNAMWIAAGVRATGLPRIAGAWIGGSVFPDQPGLARRSAEQLGDPSGRWKTALEYYETPAGKRWLERNDPLAWKDRYADVALAAIRGSDDELWPHGEAATLGAAFPSMTSALVADARHVERANPSAPYTLTSPEVVGSWRSLIRRALLGEKPLTVTASIDGKRRVSATSPGASKNATARLWWTADGSGRDPSWTAAGLSRKRDGSWNATLPKAAARWFVDVRDGDRFASTAP